MNEAIDHTDLSWIKDRYIFAELVGDCQVRSGECLVVFVKQEDTGSQVALREDGDVCDEHISDVVCEGDELALV